MYNISRQGNYTKKVQVWVDGGLYDMCKELVDNLVYRSLSELVRDGMQMALDKNKGYAEIRRKEIEEQYSEDDMIETRCRIDGTLMRLKLSARWMKLEAVDKLHYLVQDLHDPSLSLEQISEKYGTKIELYNMHQPTEDTTIFGDDFKQTYAYKLEHGLIDE